MLLCGRAKYITCSPFKYTTTSGLLAIKKSGLGLSDILGEPGASPQFPPVLSKNFGRTDQG